MAGNQIENASGSYVQPALIGTFQVQLPRTITVTNLNDSGTGSLRDAISDANADSLAADSIVFAPGLAGTITLTSGVLTIANSMTITGPAGNGIVISGNNVSQDFTVNGSGLTISIYDLDITGGTASYGGGVFTGVNTITLNTDWIHDNQAYDGGGIGLAGGATVTII